MYEKIIKTVLQNEEGQSMVEYSLLIVFLVMLTLGAFQLYADSEKDTYRVIIDNMQQS